MAGLMLIMKTCISAYLATVVRVGAHRAQPLGLQRLMYQGGAPARRCGRDHQGRPAVRLLQPVQYKSLDRRYL